jgi:hypothetical protein
MIVALGSLSLLALYGFQKLFFALVRILLGLSGEFRLMSFRHGLDPLVISLRRVRFFVYKIIFCYVSHDGRCTHEACSNFSPLLGVCIR